MNCFKIQKLQVKNFRNLNNDCIEFSPRISCIFGENGNGKTNILEAIYILLTHKSFKKNAEFPQLLSIDCDMPEIQFSSTLIDSKNKINTYSGKILNKSSEWYFNNKKSNNKFSTVFINPFDAYNFFNHPQFRRDWFNKYIGMMDVDYRKNLVGYNKCLKFRNKLLSTKVDDYKKQIMAIDENMAQYSYEVIKKRFVFIREIEEFFCQIFKEIFAQEHKFTINLKTKLANNTPRQICDLYRSYWPKDDLLNFTSYGIHKDDYDLQLDGLNSLEYCSLGQQKTCYLSLLFAYIELFRYKFLSYPILLIDDVSGELDELRWQRLVAYLGNKNFQVLITTANERFKEELNKIADVKKIKVEVGAIKAI